MLDGTIIQLRSVGSANLVTVSAFAVALLSLLLAYSKV